MVSSLSTPTYTGRHLLGYNRQLETATDHGRVLSDNIAATAQGYVGLDPDHSERVVAWPEHVRANSSAAFAAVAGPPEGQSQGSWSSENDIGDDMSLATAASLSTLGGFSQYELDYLRKKSRKNPLLSCGAPSTRLICNVDTSGVTVQPGRQSTHGGRRTRKLAVIQSQIPTRPPRQVVSRKEAWVAPETSTKATPAEV